MSIQRSITWFLIMVFSPSISMAASYDYKKLESEILEIVKKDCKENPTEKCVNTSNAKDIVKNYCGSLKDEGEKQECISVANASAQIALEQINESARKRIEKTNEITSSSETPQAGYYLDKLKNCKIYTPSIENKSGEWSGECKNGYGHGKGVLKIFLKNEHIATYEGSLLEGKIHGYGKYDGPDGIYVGGWSENYRSGPGKFINKNGVTFEGNFKKGFPDGEVKVSGLSSGNPEIQMWADGKRLKNLGGGSAEQDNITISRDSDGATHPTVTTDGKIAATHESDSSENTGIESPASVTTNQTSKAEPSNQESSGLSFFSILGGIGITFAVLAVPFVTTFRKR